MKKITFFLISLFLYNISNFAQTTEDFEDEATGISNFTHIEQTFNFTSVKDSYDIENFASGGWNGTGTDNQFIDNSGSVSITGDGTDLTIKHSNSNINFTVKELYIFCATKTLANHSGTLTITGKKDGVTVTGFSFTKNSGFSNVATFSPNNGFTRINFASEGGTDNSSKVIDELVISSTGDLDYIAIDAFRFDLISKVWDGSGGTSWSTASNWSEDAIPTSTDNVIIPNVTNKPIISSSTEAVANDVTIEASSSLTVNSGGSLIIDGTATENGDFIYKVNVNDTKWHLVSSPVSGEQFDDTWNTSNSINTNLPNEAVASYISTSDADGDWVYFQNGGAATTFGAGIGYSMQRTGAGDYTFTGNFPAPPINPTITASNIGNANENRWTLVGNPFPAHVNIATFLTTNSTPLLDTHESVYVWNANANGGAGEYQPLTTGFLHPGQGFFVSSNVASTSVTFTKAMQSDQNGVTFYRASNKKITLTVNNGTKNKSTEINYLTGKTKGLDPRFDIGTFTGQSTNFNLFTHLVSNSEGINFMKQTLPDNDYENMIIPIGVNATNGNELTFTTDVINLPSNIKVFLEDRESNTFTRLDEANTDYKVTLSQDLSGIGRFYLHTTSSALNIKSESLENISVYKSDNFTLRIVGLHQGKKDVQLFNILGEQVMNTSFTSSGVKDISLPKLASGVYIVQIETEKGKLNKKIVLE